MLAKTRVSHRTYTTCISWNPSTRTIWSWRSRCLIQCSCLRNGETRILIHHGPVRADHAIGGFGAREQKAWLILGFPSVSTGSDGMNGDFWNARGRGDENLGSCSKLQTPSFHACSFRGNQSGTTTVPYLDGRLRVIVASGFLQRPRLLGGSTWGIRSLRFGASTKQHTPTKGPRVHEARVATRSYGARPLASGFIDPCLVIRWRRWARWFSPIGDC